MTSVVDVDEAFLRALKSLPPERRKRAVNAITKFIREPALPALAFRTLKGAAGYFIIDCARGDRIILQKVGEEHFIAVDVGPHDNVYRRWDR
jgi:mRNA-degrading endonuclease RelE of RelBE toxin-antitoxin system